MPALCDEPLINRFFSIVGRLGIFGLLLDPASDLTLNQLRVLFQLHYRGDRSMGEVSSRLQVSDSTATGVVDRLVERGLVERVNDAEDRRKVLVRLSEQGQRHVAGIRGAGAAAAAAVFDSLTAAQREALYVALEPVSDLLRPAEPDSEPAASA